MALISGAIILGMLTLPPAEVADRILYTVTDLSILLLSLAVGLIPIIGGTMKESGQIDRLVNNIRIPKKWLLALSPALMGLLPIPGGALLSAPILQKAGEGVPGDLLAAVNNWFRHTLIMVYPLSAALIVATQVADLDIYRAIVYLLPAFVLATALGYVAYLRKCHGSLSYKERFSLPGLLLPLTIVLSAPILDFVLKRAFSLGSLATLGGVTTALVLSVILSPVRLNLLRIAAKMKPWNFAFIILGMFLYLHVFQKSDIRLLIAALPMPPLLLSVVVGFALGLLTGRVQLPASIVLPVYLAASPTISPPYFAVIYVAIFFGFVTSPVHPCLVVTGEYFGVPLKDVVRQLFGPAMLIVMLAFVLAVALA